MPGERSADAEHDAAVVVAVPVPVPEVLLVGLLPVYRHGLAAVLRSAGLTCATVPDGAALTSLDGAAGAALVTVLDAGQAAEVLPLLTGPGQAVLVVDHADEQAYADALRGGATGVISTEMEPEEAVAVVRSAASGQTLLPVAVARALCRSLSGPPPSVTGSERAWLRGLANGGTVSGLARGAGYSEREMYRILAGLYGRLGASSRTEALVLAERWGLLSGSTP